MYPADEELPVPQDQARQDRGGWLLVFMGVAVVATAAIVIALAGSPSRSRDPHSGDRPVARVTFGAVGLAAPDRIGALTKMPEPHPATADRRNPLDATAIDQDVVLKELKIRPEKVIVYSAVYEDGTTPGRRVVVWGGVGPGAGSPFQFQMALVRAADAMSGISDGDPVELSGGAWAGHGDCRSIIGAADADAALCAWTGDNAAVVMEFSGWTLDESVQTTKAILDSIVQID